MKYVKIFRTPSHIPDQAYKLTAKGLEVYNTLLQASEQSTPS